MKEKMKLIGIIALAAVFALGMMGCDLDPCLDGHTWDDLNVITAPTVNANGAIVDGEGDRKCLECGEEETVVISGFTLFYGTWKPASGSSYIVIDENSFRFYETTSTYFELSSMTTTYQAANGNVINNANGSNISPTLNTYKNGYGITGTKGGTALQANDNAGVYINVAKDKIICRINSYLFNNRQDNTTTPEEENNRTPYVYTKQ